MTACKRTPAYVDALLSSTSSAEQESHAAACADCGAARTRLAAFDAQLAEAARSLVAQATNAEPTRETGQQITSTRPRARFGSALSPPSSRRTHVPLRPLMGLASLGLLLVAVVTVASFLGLPPFPPGRSLGTGPADARAVERGIVVEVWLDRHEARVGDLLRALVRVSNQGDETIVREMNTCGLGPAQTIVVREASGSGGAADWAGLAGDFKRFVLRGTGLGVGEWEIGRFVDARGGGAAVGCLLSSQPGPFAPGATEELVLAWRVAKPDELQLAPGPATVRAVFGELPDASDSDPLTVVAETSIEIVADGTTDEPVAVATVVDYLDAALSDASFAAWLEERPADTWAGAHITYWPTAEGSYPEIPPFDRLGRRSVVEVALWRQLPPDERGPTDMPEGEVRTVVLDRATLVVLAVRDPLSEPSETPEPLGPCYPVDEGGNCFDPTEQAFIDHAIESTRAWPQLAGLAVQATEIIEAYDTAAEQPTWIVPITADGRIVAASRFLPFGHQVRLGEIALYQPPRDTFPTPGLRQRLIVFATASCVDPMPDQCLFSERGWRIEPSP